MIYPDFFPCPGWNYNQQTNEHLRRTQFQNGWTRERKRFAERNNTINLEFKCSTKVFAAWAAWFQNNGYDWFEMNLAQGPATVRAISPINYSYKVFDVIYAVVTVEEYVEAEASSVPVPVPPQTSRPPIPGTDIYCLEYECDAYHIYLEGSGLYYWPAYNPVSDGFLEGTVNLPANGNYTNSGPLFPDGCVTQAGWLAAESAFLDGSEIFEDVSEMGEYNFSTLYDFGSGSSDISLLVHSLAWRRAPTSYMACEVSCEGYLNGTARVLVTWPSGAGSGSLPLDLAVSNVIPNDGLPHVVSFTIGLPGANVAAGTLLDVPVTLYVDWVEVGSGTAVGDFYDGGAPWVFDPTVTGFQRLQFMAGSCNNYFSNMAINGTTDLDLEALRNAYLQNQVGYTDPDETCIPRPE